MNKFQKLKTLIFVITFPLFVYSQKESKLIRGLILNSNKIPITNATIKILNNDTNGIINQFAFSDLGGKFFIIVPESKEKIFIQISSVGYLNLTIKINDSILNKSNTFILQNRVNDLPNVHVIADRGIVKRGDTTSFKISAFSKGNEENIAELIKRLPGFKIDETGSLVYNGKIISAVLVEDDDLFGRNYGRLINNASVNGIEKIEVIENYKNLSKLENSINDGKQTVVNIKYKKFGINNFGDGKFGYDPLSNLYDIKLSNTTIAKKIKALSLLNKNQIGFLSQKLFGLNSENSFINSNNDLPKLFNNSNVLPIGIPNTQPLNIVANRIFQNNSTLLNSNFLIKPFKNLAIKHNLTFLSDNYQQNYVNTTTFLNNIIPDVITQKNDLEKKYTNYNLEGQVSYNWKKNHQTRLNYNISNIDNVHLNNGFFQSRDIQQNVECSYKVANFMLLHTYILNNNSYIMVKYFFQKSKNFGNYIFNNPLEDSILNKSLNSKSITQNISNEQSLNFFEATYYKQMKQYVISFTFTKSLDFLYTNSNASLINSLNNNVAFPNDFYLSPNLNQIDKELSINLSRKFKSSFKIEFASKFRNVKILNSLSNVNYESSNLQWLPNVSLGINLKNNQMLMFNTSIILLTPSLDNLNNSNVFTAINSISSGSKTINIQRGFDVELNYILHDPTDKKIMLNFIANYTNKPNLYNQKIQARGLYAFNTLMPFYNFRNKGLNFTLMMDKNLSDIKSWLKVKLYSSFDNSYSYTADLLTNNKTNFIQSEVRFSTNWKKFININAAVSHSFVKQISNIEGGNNNNFNSTDWLSNSTIELKLKKNVFIDLQYDLLINKSFNNSTQTLNFLDFKFRYNFSPKFYSSFLVRNLLNKKEFLTNEVLVNRNVVQNFALSPSISLLSFVYKF